MLLKSDDANSNIIYQTRQIGPDSPLKSNGTLIYNKGCLAIAKLKPLSFLISLLWMPKKAFDNVKIEKWKVKVFSALQ